jgi:tetratricopeptide (TPR) repeat protein
LAILLGALLGASNAAADIVVLKSGQRMEGRVTDAPGDSDAVVLQDAKVRLTIKRDRIESIVEEQDSVDYRRVGDQYFGLQDYQKALEYYLLSRDNDTSDQITLDKIQSTREAIEREENLKRHQQVDAISQLMDEAEKKIGARDQKQFAEAETILAKTVPEKGPTVEQLRRSRELLVQLYNNWGLDLKDKMASGQAGAYFEKALEIDPNNRVAFDNLLLLWESDNSKTPQVVEALKVKLRLNPDDMETRRKLAAKSLDLVRMTEIEGKTEEAAVDRMYEEVVTELEWLHKNDNFQKSRVERQLADTISNLYRRAEGRNDFESAIKWYRMLAIYSDTTDPTQLATLVFLNDLNKLKPSDVDDRTSLALRAREEGLGILARREVDRLRSRHPEHASVKAALEVFASDDLNVAAEALAMGQNERAMALAIQAAADYKGFEDVVARAEQIQNVARVTIEQKRRETSDEGKRYKELADQRYGEGLRHLAMLQSTERDTSIRIVSHRREAIRSFEDAIKYYDLAERRWGNIDQVSSEEIRHNRTESQKYIRTLTRTPERISGGTSTTPR